MDNNLLVIIVGIILFLTFKSFKEYFASPQGRGSPHREETYEDPYVNITKKSKVEESEFGIIAMLMAKVARADGRVCELEEQLVENMFDDLAREFRDPKEARAELQELFTRESKSGEGVELLALDFARLTKGEYKKRLKLIEFLLTLAYADGTLSHSEREVIIDIAAYLELENEDFNRIYDAFENYFASRSAGTSTTRKAALELFGLSEEEASSERIKQRYRELVRENHPDIIQGKGLGKDFIERATKKLQEINDAYEVLRLEKR